MTKRLALFRLTRFLLLTLCLSLVLGGCIVRSDRPHRTRRSVRHERRCPPGKVLINHHGKWKCKYRR